MIISLLLSLHLATTAPQFEDLFVGTYTSPQGSKGIYELRLDARTGALSEPTLAIETDNPSFLALAPGGKFLYAVDETDKGAVNAFAIGPELKLTALNGQSSEGNGPCHLSVTPGDKNLLVANYGSGSAACLPILSDGSLGKATSVYQDMGAGPNTGRQEGPHMHSIYTDVRGRFVFACDLGTDSLLIYPTTAGVNLKDPNIVKSQPGAGPRHVAESADGKFLYIANEMGNSVSLLGIDDHGATTALQTITTLPAGQTAQDIRTAEIVLDRKGKWLYVSNRGYDSIAEYAVGRDGRLTLVAIVPSPIKEPRSFAIDPSGHWMVLSGQSGNGLAVMEINRKSGQLTPHGETTKMSAPVCVLFAN